jgi:hypothetical protein
MPHQVCPKATWNYPSIIDLNPRPLNQAQRTEDEGDHKQNVNEPSLYELVTLNNQRARRIGKIIQSLIDSFQLSYRFLRSPESLR